MKTHSSLQPEYFETNRFAILISFSIFALYFLVGIKLNFLIAFAMWAGLIILLVSGHYVLREPAVGVTVMILGTALDTWGKLPGLPLTVFHVGAAITLFSFFLHRLSMQKRELKSTSFDLFLFLFIVWISFSLIYSPNRLEGLIHFIRVLVLIMIMYATINTISKKWHVVLPLMIYIFSAFVLSVIAVKTLQGTSSTLVHLAAASMGMFGRTAVSFENPNYFAAFLMLAIILAFSFIINSKFRYAWKAVLLGATILITIALVGTFSRAAIVALAPGIFIVVYFSRYRKILLITIAVALFILVIFASQSAFMQTVMMRMSSITDTTRDPSNATRIHLAMGGFEMLKDSHFIGVGYRAFPYLYVRSYRPPEQALYEVWESHTLPIEILAELGIIGFTLFVLIFYKFFSFSYRSISSIKDSTLLACQVGLVASLVAFLTNSLFSPGSLAGNMLWVGMGLVYATHHIAHDQADS